VYTGKIAQECAEGRWSFQLYGNHVIKNTFQPNDYFNNEQLSNAVIMKPSAGIKITLRKQDEEIDFAGIASVSFRDKKYSYQFLSDSKNLSAEYFPNLVIGVSGSSSSMMKKYSVEVKELFQ
jgi:hypothetical protein